MPTRSWHRVKRFTRHINYLVSFYYFFDHNATTELRKRGWPDIPDMRMASKFFLLCRDSRNNGYCFVPSNRGEFFRTAHFDSVTPNLGYRKISIQNSKQLAPSIKIVFDLVFWHLKNWSQEILGEIGWWTSAEFSQHSAGWLGAMTITSPFP